MKLKGVIIWLVVFFAGCIAMRHITADIHEQLDHIASQHQHQLERVTDVR